MKITPIRQNGDLLDKETGLYSDERWNDRRFDYTSGDLDYIGKHKKHNALTSDTQWVIIKYTWSGSNCTRIEGPLIGAWDDRASLSWGA